LASAKESTTKLEKINPPGIRADPVAGFFCALANVQRAAPNYLPARQHADGAGIYQPPPARHLSRPTFFLGARLALTANRLPAPPGNRPALRASPPFRCSFVFSVRWPGTTSRLAERRQSPPPTNFSRSSSPWPGWFAADIGPSMRHRRRRPGFSPHFLWQVPLDFAR